jgi:hypothetical protein
MDSFEIPPELRAKLQAYFDRMQTPEAKAGARALFGDGEMPEMELSPEDRAALLESLGNPPVLNEALRRAFERRAKLLGERKPVSPEQLEAVHKIRLAFQGRGPGPQEYEKDVADQGAQQVFLSRLSGPKQVVGQAMTARVEVPIYLHLMGWGDGPDRLQAGSHIYVTERDGNRVWFLAGHQQGRAGSREGGFFEAEHLGCFDEVPGQSQAR